jgi:crossover junction endodeoxyribonuclease RusA
VPPSRKARALGPGPFKGPKGRGAPRLQELEVIFMTKKNAATVHGPTKVTLDMPYPPSTNARLVRGSVGLYLTTAGRDYRKACAQAVLIQQIPRWERQIKGRLWVSINVYPPKIVRVRDLDNTLKASLDALTYSGVIEDDERIDMLLVTRGFPEGPGRLHIQIGKMERP